MSPHDPALKVAQSFDNVNACQPPLFDYTPETVIHHKVFGYKKRIIERDEPYGVSLSYRLRRSRRVLSPGLFRKRYHDVRRMLIDVLGLTLGQREVTLRLCRLWAYYGLIYPKESQITADPGCSKATYWRTLRLLQDKQLVTVVNRYIIRPHAQISNLYRLDRLMLLIARYLAEHGVGFLEKWLQPYLAMPGSQFWQGLFPAPGAGCRSSPGGAG